MPVNLSLILNVLLLIGVIIAIRKVLKARKHQRKVINMPALDKNEASLFEDIISVRKITTDAQEQAKPRLSESPIKEISPKLTTVEEKEPASLPNKPLIILIMAKENRQLAGYELLQTILAAGLRFGDGQLFHRHQYPNGQGPVLCSLAAATPQGIFDLQNIGAFQVRGLCLFMHASGNSTIDNERFTIMLETARQLRDDLDTLLLDNKHTPLNEQAIARYCSLLNIPAIVEEIA